MVKIQSALQKRTFVLSLVPSTFKKWYLNENFSKIAMSLMTTLLIYLNLSSSCLLKMKSWFALLWSLMNFFPLITAKYSSFWHFWIARTYVISLVSDLKSEIGNSSTFLKVLVSKMLTLSLMVTNIWPMLASSNALAPSRLSTFTGTLKLC